MTSILTEVGRSRLGAPRRTRRRDRPRSVAEALTKKSARRLTWTKLAAPPRVGVSSARKGPRTLAQPG